MKSNSAKRALRPDLHWGPSYRQQVLAARRDPKFRKEFAAAMKENKQDSGELTTHQLRLLAYVRVDRHWKERLLEEALNDGQELGEGWSVCSPGTLMAGSMKENGFLFLEASKRGLMIQFKENERQLMRRRGEPDATGGA